jgi:hypothetical protein
MGNPKKYVAANAPSNLVRLVDKLVPLFVDGEHPALSALREQYRGASIRQLEVSRAGFLADFEVPEDTAVASPPDFAGGHARIRLKGAQRDAGCVLFVRAGRLSALEGFTYEEEWPEGADVVSVDDVMRIEPNTTLHQHPIYGQIAEVVWTQYPNEGSLWGRKILEEVVHRLKPTCLVIDLRGFEGMFSMSPFGALVSASVAMTKLGGERKTRILAAGQTGAGISKALQISRVISIFGGAVYPDLDRALGTP